MLHFLHSTGTLTVRAGCLAITVGCVFGTDRAPKSGRGTAELHGTGLPAWVTRSSGGTFRYGVPLSNFPLLLQFHRTHGALALSLAATHTSCARTGGVAAPAGPVCCNAGS